MSDVDQSKPSGTSSKKANSRWIIGATAMVVILAGSLAIGTRFPDHLPWPISEEDSPGSIFIGTPDIYTRERLINARLREQDWLEEQFKLTHFNNPDDANRDRFAYLHLKAKQIKQRNKAITVETENPKMSGPSAGGHDAAKEAVHRDEQPITEEVAFELPTAVQYEALRAFRNRVEQEWLETQLDDRHDIAGNTIYELAFDISLLIPPRQRDENIEKIALIHMTLSKANQLEGSRLYELWQDWRTHLEPIVQSAIKNRIQTFFPEHHQTIVSSTEMASLIGLLEQSLISDPYAQAIMEDLFENLSEEENSSYENEETRQNRLIQYIKEYRAHSTRIREYNRMESFIRNLDKFCSEIKQDSSKKHDKKIKSFTIHFDESDIKIPDECDVFYERISGEYKSRVNPNYDAKIITRDPFSGYNFKYDPLPANIWEAHRQVLSFFCSPTPRGEHPNADLQSPDIGAVRNLCRGAASDSSFSAGPASRTLDPLLALLTARNILWANRPDMSHKDGRFFPFPDLYERGWQKGPDEEVRDREDFLEQAVFRRKAFERALEYYRTLDSDIGDKDSENKPEDKAVKEKDDEEVFLDDCLNKESAVRILFLCPPLPLLSRSQEIAIAALVKKELVDKGLGKFFHLELVNCEHAACYIRLNELGRHKWPERQHYEACVRAEIDAARGVGQGCRLLAEEGQFVAFKDFRDRLMTGNEVYAYDVKGETMRVGMRTRQWSDKIALSMSLAHSTVGTASTLLDFLDGGEEQFAEENQEVVGYSVARDLGDRRLAASGSSSANSDIKRDSDRLAIFGWMVSPVPLSRGGIRKYPVSALVSAPSWWRAATLQIGTCWIAIDKVSGVVRGHSATRGKLRQRGKTTGGDAVAQSSHDTVAEERFKKACGESGNSTWDEHDIQLPGHELNISHKLRIEVVDEPNLQGIGLNSLPDGSIPNSQLGVMAGRSANIVLLGDRLWRNPRVFLGAQRADLVQVLPDMTGLVANFRCIEKPIEFATRRIGRIVGSDRRPARTDDDQRPIPTREKQAMRGAFGDVQQTSNAGRPVLQDETRTSRHISKRVDRSLRVWTSEGSTRTTQIPVYPFSDEASEPPCYMHDLLNKEDIREIVRRSFQKTQPRNSETRSYTREDLETATTK